MSRFPAWVYAALLVAVVAPLAGGAWVYGFQRDQVRAQAEMDLAMVARLKADEIAQWRAERCGDASVLTDSPFLADGVRRWMVDGSTEDREGILTWFRTLSDDYGYADVLLVDPRGSVLLSLTGFAAPLHEDAIAAVTAAVQERRPQLTDIHEGSAGLGLHLDVVAPLFLGPPEQRRPLGAVVLRCEARDFLFPLIQTWPGKSTTAETLLVRRDGDDVLFLNELRHAPGAALKLRIPLTQTDVPAVMAANDVEGLVEGRDYRGVRVLAALAAIPDSPWRMVAKIDVAEALAGWRFTALLIALLTVVLIGAASATVFVFWQRERKVHYHALYQTEVALRRTEARHMATLMSVGDGVIATDAEGKVDLMNPVAEALTGFTADEARGRPADEVFRIVNEETGQAVESPVARVMREGTVVGLANHTVLIARDGTERPIADSGAPVHDSDGALTGVVLVFRDQTRQRAADRAIRESEELFRAAFEQAATGMSMTAPDGRLLRVNQALCDMLGRSPDEMLKLDYVSITHPEDIAGSKERVRAMLAGEATGARFTKRYVHKDGHAVWADVATHLLRDAAGAPVHFITQVQDITERVVADERLRRSESRLRSVLGAAPIGIGAVVDRVITEVNPRLCDMIGYSPDELVGRSARILYPTEEEFERVGRVKYPQIEKHGIGTVETRFKRKDGTVIDVVLRSARIDRADPSQGVSFTVLDITDRKRAEEELRRERDLNERYVDTARTIMVALDPEGRITMINRFGCELLGYSKDELLGRNWFETCLPQPEGMEEVYPVFEHIMAGNIDLARYFENRIQCRDGSTRLIAWYNAHLTDDAGRVVGTLSSGEDITDRRAAEEEKERLQSQLIQAQKMESVGRLAGGVAHDFNNMLQAILGYTEIALEAAGPEAHLRPHLEEIRKAAERSAHLTRQLLAFARRQPIAPRIADLNSLVSGTLGMLRRLIGEDIDLAWLPGHDPWHVFIDPSQVDQVLANLIVNARDAITGVGKITIETANTTLDEAYCADHMGFRPGAYVRLAVSDDGCGMDQETLSHVFEPFFTTKPHGEGTGLGLATVYGIVKQNGGFVNIYSEPGKGTTVAIYLPRHIADRVDSIAPRREGELLRGTETVLMVEDDVAILDLVRTILEDLGYTVLATSRPGDALKLISEYEGHIDLLITDVVMPEMSGRDLAERMAAARPGLKTLYMSGYTANVIAHRGILEEGVTFVQKPFTIEELSAKIREALGD